VTIWLKIVVLIDDWGNQETRKWYRCCIKPTSYEKNYHFLCTLP